MRFFRYNAPVTLTFALIATLVQTIDLFFPGMPLDNRLALNRLSLGGLSALKTLTYVFSHAGWAHLSGNLSLILLLGPGLEEKYGPWRLIFMMAATAVGTGILNLLLFHTGLAGASGIVFLFIVLSSFANARGSGIPLTFVLVALLYLAQEVLAGLSPNNVSQFAHLAGAGFGALFGFTLRSRAG